MLACSTLTEQRKLDSEAIGWTDLIVADMVEEVAHDTGDMIAATRAVVQFADKIVGLAEVFSDTHSGWIGRNRPCSTYRLIDQSHPASPWRCFASASAVMAQL